MPGSNPNFPQRPLYSGAPDPSWVPSTRVSGPVQHGGSAPRPAPRAVLKGPKLPPPLPPVRHVVLEAATSWKRRHGDWRRHTRFVVDTTNAQADSLTAIVDQVEALAPTLVPVAVAAGGTEAAPAQAAALPKTSPPPVPQAQPVETSPPAPEAPVLETLVADEAVEIAARVPAAASRQPALAQARDELALGEWDVLLLAGPVGSGKSSVTRHLTELLPHGAYVQMEPLRDKNFTSLVGEAVRPMADDEASTLEIWSGQTSAARPKAVEIAKAFVERGLRVVLDDMIETAADLRAYQQELDGLRIGVVALMPSISELELRDKLRPPDQQFGKRLADYRTTMVRQLGEQAQVIETSDSTTQEIAERVLAALQP